jgi:hypothetical protein
MWSRLERMWSKVEGMWSRVKGTWSRAEGMWRKVEGMLSRVESIWSRVEASNEGNVGLRKLVESGLSDGCTSEVAMEAKLKVEDGRA